MLSLSIKFCGTSYVILMKILYNWRNDIDNPVNTELITNIQRPAVKFKAEGKSHKTDFLLSSEFQGLAVQRKQLQLKKFWTVLIKVMLMDWKVVHHKLSLHT